GGPGLRGRGAGRAGQPVLRIEEATLAVSPAVSSPGGGVNASCGARLLGGCECLDDGGAVGTRMEGRFEADKRVSKRCCCRQETGRHALLQDALLPSEESRSARPSRHDATIVEHMFDVKHPRPARTFFDDECR